MQVSLAHSEAHMRHTLLTAVALVAGCGWNHLPNQDSVYIDGSTWDATGVIPAEGGLYVRLPSARALAWVGVDGTTSLVDIGVSELLTFSPSPDGQTIASFAVSYTCTGTDKGVKTPTDCAEDDLESTTELVVVKDGAVTQNVALPSPYNSVRWSPDGRFAVLFLDLDGSGLQDGGVVSLTNVLVVDLQEETATTVPVGFAANEILFDADAARAVVLSQNEVAVLDMTTSPPVTEVTFGLTLDADDVVVPVGIELTPAGDHALISVEGDDSLYILDLVNPSVNIKTLSGDPSAMVVNDSFDQTVLVYRDEPIVDVIEHGNFEVEPIELDEPMSHVLEHEDTLVLYSRDGFQDVYVLRFSDDEGTVRHDLVELRLQDNALSMHLAPSGEYAIALTSDGYLGGRYGMEVLDLRPDREATYPYALEGQGIGLAFSEAGDSLQALLLQRDVDYLYMLDLETAATEAVDLSAPPVEIGALPSGEFYITHNTGTGLVTFIDPTTGDITEVAGFAVLDLLNQTELYVPEEGN